MEPTQKRYLVRGMVSVVLYAEDKESARSDLAAMLTPMRACADPQPILMEDTSTVEELAEGE